MPLNGGPAAPGPRGLRPLPCRAFGTLGRHSPLLLPSREGRQAIGEKVF